MKKLFVSSLLAILTLTASAQTNTYAMVIEMQNGTKLTIGPNEVKNVTFNNGELTVTGETIETLVAGAVNEAKEYTDQAAANLKGYIDLAVALEQVKGSVNSLTQTVANNQTAALLAIKDQATQDAAAWRAAIDLAIESLVKTYQLNSLSEKINAAGLDAMQFAKDYANAQDAAQNTITLDRIKEQAQADNRAWNAAIDVAVESLVRTYQLNSMDVIINNKVDSAILNLIQTYNLQKP